MNPARTTATAPPAASRRISRYNSDSSPYGMPDRFPGRRHALVPAEAS